MMFMIMKIENNYILLIISVFVFSEQIKSSDLPQNKALGCFNFSCLCIWQKKEIIRSLKNEPDRNHGQDEFYLEKERNQNIIEKYCKQNSKKP